MFRKGILTQTQKCIYCQLMPDISLACAASALGTHDENIKAHLLLSFEFIMQSASVMQESCIPNFTTYVQEIFNEPFHKRV